MFKLIACINNKNYIGKDGKLLYHIKNDMKFFKKMTTDNVVIMGRKTFESLPNKKPLQNRINVIITSNKEFCIDECNNAYIVSSIKDAIELCKSLFYDKDWYVIGGASIYKQFLKENLIDTMYLTRVCDDTIGDTDIPELEQAIKSSNVSYICEKRFDEETKLEYRLEIIKNR